jgi:hypothetical protein
LDLKWREMQRKMNFRHPKWQPKWKLCFDLKWWEIQEKLVSFWNLGPFIITKYTHWNMNLEVVLVTNMDCLSKLFY